MRTSVAAMAATSVLFVGVYAISEAAQQSESTARSQGGAAEDSFNASVDIFGGVAQAGGEGIVWFGAAAIVLVALGVLVASQGGGR